MLTGIKQGKCVALRFEVFTRGPILGRSGYYLILHASKKLGWLLATKAIVEEPPTLGRLQLFRSSLFRVKTQQKEV